MKPYFHNKNRKFNLYLGDFFDVIKSVKTESIDMIFADPPYLLFNSGFTAHAGKMVSLNKGAWDVSKSLKKDFEFHL